MKILKLIAENFKRLSAVEITPDGNVVVISGKNAAGKSSVLDAIEAALCGGKMPKKPIKDGEVRAKVEVDMGEYKVTRKFFGANSTLTVQTTGETKSEIRSPQAFLDKVVGNLSFDPLAFLNKQPAEQRNTLMEFLGLNLQDFTDRIETIKAQRSEVRKEKERRLHEAESITTTPNLPPQEVSSESLLAELKKIQTHNNQYQKIRTENAVRLTRLDGIHKDIVAAKKSIQDWQTRLTNLQRLRASLDHEIGCNSPGKEKDPAEVEAKLKSLSATNEAIRRNNQKRAAMVDADIHASAYRDLGDEIKMVEHRKAKKLAETVMPIEGLSILSDGLGYNGLPLEQECQSKRLKICVAIAMAMNPKLKVLRIDGNGLDKDSLVAIGELVAGKDYQVWIEKVSDDNKIGFYIEDGNLVESNTYCKPDVGGEDV
jgi:DNA repair exonuclease SbcCD ATPase subunit